MSKFLSLKLRIIYVLIYIFISKCGEMFRTDNQLFIFRSLIQTRLTQISDYGWLVIRL